MEKQEILNRIQDNINKVLLNEKNSLSPITINFFSDINKTFFNKPDKQISIKLVLQKIKFIDDILDIIDSSNVVDIKCFITFKRLLKELV
jgi:hypothetical protein